MARTLNNIELAKKLATLVHRFNELPKYFLSYSKHDVKTISMFWEWAEDTFLQDDLVQKQHMIWNNMQKDTEARNRAHGIWNDIVKYTGIYLFQHLNEKVQTEEEIRALVQCVPEALCYSIQKDTRDPYDPESLRVFIQSDGNDFSLSFPFILPVHSAICSEEALSFVPVLVEEGMKHDVPLVANTNNVILCEDWLEKKGIQDRYDSRGGLLSFRDYIDDLSWPSNKEPNALQLLAKCRRHYCSDKDNEKVVKIFDQLRDRNIIKKQDISKYQLMSLAADRKTLHLLKWIVDWEPNSLLMQCKNKFSLSSRTREEAPLIHYYAIPSKHFSNSIGDVLDLAFCYFPQQLGLLFLEDEKTGNTTFSIAYKAIEKEESIQYRFQHLRTMVIGGNAAMELYNSMSYETRAKVKLWSIIEEALSKGNPLKYLALDEETCMFPFMLAAKGEGADLNLVYYLMRKDPQVWSVV